MTPPRPALADVLAAFTNGSAAWWRSKFEPRSGLVRRVEVHAHEVNVAGYRGANRAGVFAWGTLTVTDPSEALEILVAHDLWPWPTEGSRAAHWWCESCALSPVEGCSPTEPANVAAIVEVASFGSAALLRTASLADAIAPGSTLEWRSEDLIVMENRARAKSGTWPRLPDLPAEEPHTVEHAAAVEDHVRRMCRITQPGHWREPWPRECPYTSPDVRAAWGALRALTVDDDARPTGIHLLSSPVLPSSPRRVTLCVEAL